MRFLGLQRGDGPLRLALSRMDVRSADDILGTAESGLSWRRGMNAEGIQQPRIYSVQHED
jgi:hypothetical protein